MGAQRGEPNDQDLTDRDRSEQERRERACGSGLVVWGSSRTGFHTQVPPSGRANY